MKEELFNEMYTDEYFSVKMRNRVLLLICKEIVLVFIDYNLKRHYLQKHATKMNYIKDFFENKKCILKSNILFL